jgi:hypothetical protein
MSTPLRLVEPQHLTGAALLDAVSTFLARFIVFPNEYCASAIALWFAHTQAAEHFYVTPRLVISSAEPGSGKTLVIEVGQYLAAKPQMVLNASPAAVFRLVAADGPISLLWDEVDTVFTTNGVGNEELRSLLNSGYKRTATIPRCVGDSHTVQQFPISSPVALVGLAGAMPVTITTHAITIHMRRKKRNETAEEFRERDRPGRRRTATHHHRRATPVRPVDHLHRPADGPASHRRHPHRPGRARRGTVG